MRIYVLHSEMLRSDHRQLTWCCYTGNHKERCLSLQWREALSVSECLLVTSTTVLAWLWLENVIYSIKFYSRDWLGPPSRLAGWLAVQIAVNIWDQYFGHRLQREQRRGRERGWHRCQRVFRKCHRRGYFAGIYIKIYILDNFLNLILWRETS